MVKVLRVGCALFAFTDPFAEKSEGVVGWVVAL